MEWPANADAIQNLLLIFARMGGLVMTAPVFSSHRVPPQLRAAISVIMTLIIFPLVRPMAIENSIINFGLLILNEVIIGLVLGFTANMIFMVIQVSGEIQDTQIGFGFAGVVDPNMGQSSAIIGQLQMIMMWIIFVAANGHHFLLRAITESFILIPPGLGTFQVASVNRIVAISAEMLMLALKIGAPVIAAVLVADLSMGVLQRTAPQLNLMAVGFQVKIAVGVIVLILAMPMIVSMQYDLVSYMARIFNEMMLYFKP
jgi:flagellar biosynthetic protein FliR